MAQVVRERQLPGRIEHDLDYLMSEWQNIPTVAAEWDEWDEHERLNFVIEWPLREDRLNQLHRWAKHDRLTPPQRDRYDRLLDVVSMHRPLLDTLLRD